MKPKPRTMRDAPTRPTNSAMPRSEGAIFLMLNRLASERERLLNDEAELMARLEQKRKRLVAIEAEIEQHKSRSELLSGPQRPATARYAASRPIADKENAGEWQSLTFEY